MSAFCGVIFFRFGLLCLHLLSCWLFVALSPFILAFCSFIYFHVGFLRLHLLFIFGLLWLYFLSFFAFCGFISFHFLPSRLYLLSFWLLCGFMSFHFFFAGFISFILASLWLHFLALSMFLPTPMPKIQKKHRVFSGFGLLKKKVKTRCFFASFEKIDARKLLKPMGICTFWFVCFLKTAKTHGFVHFFGIALFKKG